MNSVEDYLKAHSLQKRDAMDIIEEFGDELSRMRGKCVDIGCGPGTVTRELILPKLPVDATVVGVDILRDMIDFARKAHTDEMRLSFMELDVGANELPSNQINAYDNAVSFYCLHWCQNIGRAFKNIYQLLRPGGNALVLILASHNTYDSYLKLHDNPSYKPYMKDVSRYIPYFHHCNNPKAALERILEESGFEVLHCSSRERTYAYKSMQVLKKHMVAVNPFIARIPEDLRKQFANDLVHNIASKDISITDTKHELNEEDEVLDRYCLLIAHFKKLTD